MHTASQRPFAPKLQQITCSLITATPCLSRLLPFSQRPHFARIIPYCLLTINPLRRSPFSPPGLLSVTAGWYLVLGLAMSEPSPPNLQALSRDDAIASLQWSMRHVSILQERLLDEQALNMQAASRERALLADLKRVTTPIPASDEHLYQQQPATLNSNLRAQLHVVTAERDTAVARGDRLQAQVDRLESEDHLNDLLFDAERARSQLQDKLRKLQAEVRSLCELNSGLLRTLNRYLMSHILERDDDDDPYGDDPY